MDLNDKNIINYFRISYGFTKFNQNAVTDAYYHDSSLLLPQKRQVIL